MPAILTEHLCIMFKCSASASDPHHRLKHDDGVGAQNAQVFMRLISPVNCFVYLRLVHVSCYDYGSLVLAV